VLNTIEINGSFYSLQRPESYAKWHADTPDDFTFTVKAPRYITHMRRLREVEEPLANSLASGLFNLRNKLGPILWQFPPNFKYDRERMEPFLELLPPDTDAARALARKRSAWMKGRTRLPASEPNALRHAIEIRHESFLAASFVDLLRAHNVTLVIAETARRWPMAQDITADFVYGYTTTRSSTGAAIKTRRSLAGRAGSAPGIAAGTPPMRKKISDDKVPKIKGRDVYATSTTRM